MRRPCWHLARAALRPDSNSFLMSFLPFLQRIARFGVQNSLSQTVFKLTAPGVPDIYQGCELWDFSLVDPDNRRPVDFQLRERALRELAPRIASIESRRALFEALMESWRDGRVKLGTTALLLAFRAGVGEFFRTRGLSADRIFRRTSGLGPWILCAPLAKSHWRC